MANPAKVTYVQASDFLLEGCSRFLLEDREVMVKFSLQANSKLLQAFLR